MPKIIVKLGIGISGAYQKDVLEIDEDEWEGLDSDYERERRVISYVDEWASNYIDLGYEIVD